jgi:hypothetical protein
MSVESAGPIFNHRDCRRAIRAIFAAATAELRLTAGAFNTAIDEIEALADQSTGIGVLAMINRRRDELMRLQREQDALIKKIDPDEALSWW